MDYTPNQKFSYSLSDFFNFNGLPHAFQTITGWKYPEDCFHHPKDVGCFTTYPIDPDDDGVESN